MPKTPPPLPPQEPGEGDCAYSLFLEYCQSGPKRSLRTLSELTGRSRASLGSLSGRFRWPERSAAWDRSHAIADPPAPRSVEVLGDRNARLEQCLDLAIDLVADKLNSLDPTETPARTIKDLISSLATCMELSAAFEPASMIEEFDALTTLLPHVGGSMNAKVAVHLTQMLKVFKGDLDATLALNERDIEQLASIDQQYLAQYDQ